MWWVVLCGGIWFLTWSRFCLNNAFKSFGLGTGAKKEPYTLAFTTWLVQQAATQSHSWKESCTCSTLLWQGKVNFKQRVVMQTEMILCSLAQSSVTFTGLDMSRRVDVDVCNKTSEHNVTLKHDTNQLN
eukprot:974055-Amphidinium_carterae.1